MHVTEPYKLIWLGDIPSPKPYEFTGSRATMISRTPVPNGGVLRPGEIDLSRPNARVSPGRVRPRIHLRLYSPNAILTRTMLGD